MGRARSPFCCKGNGAQVALHGHGWYVGHGRTWRVLGESTAASWPSWASVPSLGHLEVRRLYGVQEPQHQVPRDVELVEVIATTTCERSAQPSQPTEAVGRIAHRPRADQEEKGSPVRNEKE
eukprot:3116027-Pyramimonas_sp.AAC.1